MSCGIYCIENKVNGKKYIGQSVNIEERWQTHKSKLKDNKHINSYLQNSWNKNGESAFEFSIIELCDVNELNEREVYWIEFYNSFDSGFNLTIGGDGGNTHKAYTDKQLVEYRRKQSLISRNAEENNPMSKLTKQDVSQIIQQLLNGEYVTDIAKDYGVHFTTICDIKNHRTWTEMTKGIVFPNTSKCTIKGIHGKRVNQYSLDGIFIASFVSAREAEKATGCAYQNIYEVCSGKRKSCMGYVWRYAD